MRDTPCVETARKIASDSELRQIAAAGAGFIVDPFNRRWHVATCPRILDMTVRQPKWFAVTVPALEAFMRQRLMQHPNRKADPGLYHLRRQHRGRSGARSTARACRGRRRAAEPAHQAH
jgi:hypothetical protein